MAKQMSENTYKAYMSQLLKVIREDKKNTIKMLDEEGNEADAMLVANSDNSDWAGKMVWSVVIPQSQTLFNSDSSYKQFLSACKHIKSLGFNITKQQQDEIDLIVTPIIKNISDGIKLIVAQNKATPKEAPKLMNWELVQAKIDEAYPTMNSYERILAHLYFKMPPRRLEYGELIYSKNAGVIEGVEGFNYVYDSGNDLDFWLGNYKTYKTYGFYHFSVKKSSEFGRAILSYLTQRMIKSGMDLEILEKPYEWEMKLFPFTNHDLGRSLVRYSQKFLGVDMNLNMIRHNYVTAFLNKSPHPTLKEKNDISYAMGHSIVQQAEYLKYEIETEED